MFVKNGLLLDVFMFITQTAGVNLVVLSVCSQEVVSGMTM